MTAKPEGSSDTVPHPVECTVCGATTPPPALTCGTCGATIRFSKLREPGTVLGSYRLIDVLGEGGMGVVYLAEHTRLGRRVAIKMLRSEYSNNPSAVHRFFAEARAVNKICHQNIVEITDFVEHPGADNYYIMELLQGSSLAKLIDGQPRLPLARSAGIMTQIARALEAVHEAGIVHRDLKPDNVFLIERAGQKDFVKLLDFGVAKLGEQTEGIALHRTAAGAILGTPEYMSPEQASGKSVDYRTDLYAFGVMLYELVTGVLPLTGTSFGELVVKHLTVAPTPPSRVKDLPHEIPATLEDLILACLAKDPGDRPDHIRTVITRLEAIADDEGWNLVTFADSPRTTGQMAAMPRLQKSRPPANEPAPPAKVIAPKRSRAPLIAAIGVGAALVISFAIWKATEPATRAAAPVPTPAAAQKVEIEFASTPSGADVFRAGESIALGRTPFTAALPPSDRVEVFEIRLDGRVTATERVRLDRASRIAVALSPTPTPVADTPAPLDAATAKGERPGTKKTVRVTTRPIPPRKPEPGTAPVPKDAGSATKPVDRSGVLNPFDKR